MSKQVLKDDFFDEVVNKFDYEDVNGHYHCGCLFAQLLLLEDQYQEFLKTDAVFYEENTPNKHFVATTEDDIAGAGSFIDDLNSQPTHEVHLAMHSDSLHNFMKQFPFICRIYNGHEMMVRRGNHLMPHIK